MVKVILKLLIGGALLAALIWKANPKEVIVSLSDIPLDLVAYCSAIFLFACFVAAYKWYILLPHSRYTEFLALWFIGQLYSWIFPGQIAGEIVKALRLGRGRANSERLALSVLVDKLAGLIGLLCVAAIGLLLSDTQVPSEISLGVAILTASIVICLWSVRLPLVYRSIRALIGKAAKRWPQRKRFGLRILRLLTAWRYYVMRPFRLVLAIFLGAIFQLICVTITMLLANGMGFGLGYFDWCWIFGLVSVAVLLPISIGGIGVREGAFAGALSLHGVPVGQSVALSLAGFAITLLGVFIGGVLELCRHTDS